MNRSDAIDCLNPFENQVYFYDLGITINPAKGTLGLNPFENQVYFYRIFPQAECRPLQRVLIPLRIRSISTALAS